MGKTQLHEAVGFGFSVGDGDKLLCRPLAVLFHPDDQDTTVSVRHGGNITQHLPGALGVAALIHLALEFQAGALSSSGSNQCSEIDLGELV
jgi:hypothetical protein